VLQFLVNRLQVRGKIGVYGRSIGGIAASHLVKKFPRRIKAFVGDRTMGDFENIVRNRYSYGHRLLSLYRLLSCKWRANNVDGFLENKYCFKISTFDQNDDVVDIFSAHHQEIANHFSKHDYRGIKWQKFYESLKLLF
jgi:pimeloyl-ACP methyl ester carboxylesterase